MVLGIPLFFRAIVPHPNLFPPRSRYPASPVHVEPFPGRLVALRIRSHPQYISIQVFHLHFVSPWIIRRRVTHFGSGCAIFVEQRFCVLHSNPHPRTRMSLVAFAQKNVALPARNGCEPARPSPFHVEAKLANVVLNARCQILHPQYRRYSFKLNSTARTFVSHENSPKQIIFSGPFQISRKGRAFSALRFLCSAGLQPGIFFFSTHLSPEPSPAFGSATPVPRPVAPAFEQKLYRETQPPYARVHATC